MKHRRLMPQNFIAIAAKSGIRMEDIADGVEAGKEKGWFEDGKNSFIMLTEAGFAEV